MVKSRPTTKTLKKNNVVRIKVILGANSVSPIYNIHTDPGAILGSSSIAPISLQPGERKLIPTGIKLQFEKGLKVRIWVYKNPTSPRKDGPTIFLGSPGLTDLCATPNKEINIPMENHNEKELIILHGCPIAYIFVVTTGKSTIKGRQKSKLVCRTNFEVIQPRTPKEAPNDQSTF